MCLRLVTMIVALALMPATGEAKTGSLGLQDAASVRLAGDQAGDHVGEAAGIGDFNGDGVDDIAIGGLFSGAESPLRYITHDVFVHFWTPGPRIGLVRSTQGLYIKHSAGYLGGEVADAGDVNGDGLGDVVLGGITSAWVVFGGPQQGTLDLASVGPRGFRITGASEERLFSVDGVGDVNGDGLSDVVVGSKIADPDGRAGAGAAYVVYGKSTTGEVRTAALGDAGFRISGAEPGSGVGAEVAGPGDVNGDGRGDVLLSGVRRTLDPRDINVVFTPADQADVDLAQAHPGFAIENVVQPVISGAGDVNNDGYADLLVGDVGAGGADICGSAFVVFGKPGFESVDLHSLGGGGFDLEPGETYNLGYEVAPAGDVNADGFSDVVVHGRASGFLDRHCGTPDGPEAGAAWVVFGRTSGGQIPLDDLGPNGFRIMVRGHAGGYAPLPFGFAVGDRDGDGRDDIGIGVGFVCQDDGGSVFIVPSPASPASLPADPFDRAAETWIGTQLGDQRLGTAFGDMLAGDGGHDCLGGADGDDELSGGDGDDELVGGLGVDVLAGDAGNDRLSPGGIEAFVYPGDPDVLLGGPGDDTLGSEEYSGKGFHVFGELGDDRFDGDEGNDGIDAGIGNDTASGGPGDDRVSGDSGDDQVAGDADDDRLDGDAGNDVVAGGPGDDVMGIDGSRSSFTETGDDIYAGDAGNDAIGTGAGNDTASGGRGDDRISGEIGADLLGGGAGDDFLKGGRGRDRLRGRSGRDKFVAGPGKDFVHSRDGLGEVIRCGRGQDTVKADSLDRLIACEIAK